jgi:multisubunit Na+/H+ antiporter MnhE subunit
MKLSILNLYLTLSWVLITIGGCVLNLGAGLIVSGVVLAFLTLFLAHKAGVYVPKPETETEAH